MNNPLVSDLYIFNFPEDFVPDEIEERYKLHLKNYRKPYSSILDYINSNIKNITLPAMSFPTVNQKQMYGKERTYRSSIPPNDVFQREFNVIIGLVDFYVNYFILQDILLYHFMKNRKPFIDWFSILILDEERNEIFKIYLKEIVNTGLSDITLGYDMKQVDEKTVTISFKYNFIDIEYIPKITNTSNDSEIIEKYSDIIIKNDDNIKTF